VAVTSAGPYAADRYYNHASISSLSFYMPATLPDGQTTVSIHWRQFVHVTGFKTYLVFFSTLYCLVALLTIVVLFGAVAATECVCIHSIVVHPSRRRQVSAFSFLVFVPWQICIVQYMLWWPSCLFHHLSVCLSVCLWYSVLMCSIIIAEQTII